MWLKKWYSGKVFIAILIFYSIRAILQGSFFLGRHEGFLWEDPGLPSLVIAYHDCNDFYYSGHVGLSTLLMCELWICGDFSGFLVSIFVLVNEWLMLTFVRTHYTIDMIDGFVCAKVLLRCCEVLSYYWDVSVLGLKRNKRSEYYFKTCERCGWSNRDASLLVSKEELKFQVKIRSK